MTSAVVRKPTVVLPATAAASITRAVQVLREGGLVAFPTDTVYGVGALAWQEESVARLFEAKGRPRDKAIPLLLADASDMAAVAQAVPSQARQLMAAYWPGPLTLVVPRSAQVADIITGGGDTVAVRVPDHPVALALLRHLSGPLAATSANRSGFPSPCTAVQVIDQLAGHIEVVLDGGTCPGGTPSTVVAFQEDRMIILREGPIGVAGLRRTLGGTRGGCGCAAHARSVDA